MIIGFIGGSIHTVRLLNKSILEGYKGFALYEHGYTFSFMYTSRVEQFSGQDLDLPYLGPGILPLSPTSCAVLRLAAALPSGSTSLYLIVITIFAIFHCFKL